MKREQTITQATVANLVLSGDARTRGFAWAALAMTIPGGFAGGVMAPVSEALAWAPRSVALTIASLMTLAVIAAIGHAAGRIGYLSVRYEESRTRRALARAHAERVERFRVACWKPGAYEQLTG